MHYSLVDDFDSDQEVPLWNGQRFSAPAVLRDERGIRVLLVPGESVSSDIWSAARTAGVQFLYHDTGAWLTADEFEELADVRPSEGLHRFPLALWHPGLDQDLFGPQEPAQGREEAPADDTHRIPFVQLHLHSEYSALDGLSTLEEILAEVVAQGQGAVAITDHGVVVGHPELQELCEENNVKPIFGMEAYLVDDRFDRTDAKNYYHLTLWAMNDKGLQNLWAISTEGHVEGGHGHPRVDWDTLQRLNEGVIAGSGCLRGPVAHEVMKGNINKAIVNSQRLVDIFGDRYYIEMHANLLDDQIKVNKWLYKHANELGLPMIAVTDSHYARKEQRDDHQVWISVQTAKDVADESSLFGGGQDYHMLNDDEIFFNLSYLGQDEAVVTMMMNTVKLADRCDAKITHRIGMPRYHNGPDAEQRDIDLMFEWIEQAWEERTRDKPYSQEEAFARLDREVGLLVPKGFPGYFLMNSDLVRYAKDHGVQVGPGRGSGAGSFVAYILKITETDALEHNLAIERFMTQGRVELPDFDIDYPSSKKQFMIEYAESRWGKSHVCAISNSNRMKNKGAFKDVARAISSRLPEGYFSDVEQISKIIGQAEASTAGLGLSWDDLMDAVGEEFEPFIEKYPYLFEMAEKFRGRLRTYGRHAAGLVIDPQYNLEGTLPMFLHPDGKTLVCQFDKDIIDKLGYVKFDFLNLRNLDTIQLCVDMIKEQLGITVDVNSWREEYRDPLVFKEIADGWTLGCFQIETPLGTRTVKQLKPETLDHLADCITLGRPGPIRSGLDKTYFRRREGKEKVSFADPRLQNVLARTYGTMIYQEDIMGVCISLAGYTDTEADYVRKILGKKKPEEAKKEGSKFIERAIETGTMRVVAEGLWKQMEEFSRYSFNRAHAFAYAVLSYWTAWLKWHYPVQYLTACLSTVEMDDIPDYVVEARRKRCRVLPPDINVSKVGFANDEESIRYGLESLKGIGGAASSAIIAGQPYASFEDFMERKGDCDRGQVKILVHIGAFDSIEPNRRMLETQLAEDDLKAAERCIFYQLEPRNKYNNLPCGFDWDTEPKELGRTGKPKKTQKPPPKRCAKSCRQWTPRDLPSDIKPYTEEEIRHIEMETLGIYLSSSPFDIIPEGDREFFYGASELAGADSGTYPTAMLVTRVKDYTTRNGKPMKFVTVDTPSGNMDLTVFADEIRLFGDSLRVGQMATAEVRKNDRGVSLKTMESI